MAIEIECPILGGGCNKNLCNLHESFSCTSTALATAFLVLEHFQNRPDDTENWKKIEETVRTFINGLNFNEEEGTLWMERVRQYVGLDNLDIFSNVLNEE